MMPNSIRIGVVDGALTRELRRRVLRPHLGRHDAMPGDGMPEAVHIAAIDGKTVLGTCFVYEEPCYWRPEDVPAWRLKQMATAPERRGEGIGAAVLVAAQRAARERGARLLWCHARETAAGFYAAHGWQAYGPEFVDEATGLPHLHMSWEPSADPTSSTG